MLELEWVGGVRVGAILQRDYKRTCFASAVVREENPLATIYTEDLCGCMQFANKKRTAKYYPER